MCPWHLYKHRSRTAPSTQRERCKPPYPPGAQCCGRAHCLLSFSEMNLAEIMSCLLWLPLSQFWPLPPSRGSSRPASRAPKPRALGALKDHDVESDRSQVDVGEGLGPLGTWGCLLLPGGGIPAMDMSTSVFPSVNEDTSPPTPLALEGCSGHLLQALLGTGSRLALSRTAARPASSPVPLHLPPPEATCSLCPHPHPRLPRVRARAYMSSRVWEGRGGWQRDRTSPSVILFLWFSFQAVTVNLFYLSLCKSLCRIKPFTSF